MEVADRPQVLTEEQKKLVGNTPNIYYFILDGYGGRQVLDEHYRLDNSQFLSFLEDQGFWVSESSRSNYLRTLLSLPSSLNLEYLDEFIEINELEETTDERPAIFMMRNSLVKAYLTNFGYDTVGISSGFTGWNMSGAESYIDQKRAGTNEFQSIVNSHTPVFHVARELAVMDPFAKHRELHNSTLETVPQIPAQYPDSPIFTFIHMMCPHPPFVFKEDGSPAQPSEPLFHLGDGDYLVGVSMDTMEYQVGYANQLLHLNTLMTKAITDLRAADPEAIIIIQGDHGPGSHYVSSDIMQNNMVERSSILNAIYLPGPGREDLYDTISPVNTFRVIFNNYFGDDQELLPDKTYFSELRKPYKMYQLNFGSPESQDSQ